jgi:hypothetical protein
MVGKFKERPIAGHELNWNPRFIYSHHSNLKKNISCAIQGLNCFLKKFMSYSGVFFKNGKVHELKL